MSAPIRTNLDEGSETPSMFPDATSVPTTFAPTMYAPPWARDAAMNATNAALAATEQFRRTLPPAAQLGEKRRRDKPFDGDIAIRQLRERGSLDPVPLPEPPIRAGSSVGVFARVAGAVGLAALAAFFMVGTAPLSLAVKAEGDGAPSIWSRFVFPINGKPGPEYNLASVESAPPPAALSERLAAASPIELPSQPTQMPVQPVRTVAVTPDIAPPPAPAPTEAAQPEAKLRALDREEVAMLFRRGERMVDDGDIAAARLMFARAVEAGDARSALALGATFDPLVLKRLGVLGVPGDVEQARHWYGRAAELGSSEASRRIEQLAQAQR
jgi:hypothetical protein